MDDCLIVGHKKQVLHHRNDMMDRFDCDDVGEMREYVGCKIERDIQKRRVKITQPVLLQSFVDEFNITDKPHETPAVAGETLRKGEPDDCIEQSRTTKYRSGVGKLLHLTKWSRPDIQNAVRELSRYMSKTMTAHETAMKRTME